MKIYCYGNPEADVVLVQLVDEYELENIERENKNITEEYKGDFCLAAVKVNDWNMDLSPWKAPAVFGREGFGGGAQKTLDEITKLCSDKTKTYIIGGYSLAGLFALWAAYNTDIFSGVAAASPSMWFPGFIDYMKEKEILSGKIYLSLGDREEKAKNPVMSTVGSRIREAYTVLSEKGTDCILEWNEGNHFRDADIRTAKAFSWVLRRMNK
ncbi:MAG: esterase [Clostridiales bacterium]|nr:esterase [Clostridiales bacterium]